MALDNYHQINGIPTPWLFWRRTKKNPQVIDSALAAPRLLSFAVVVPQSESIADSANVSSGVFGSFVMVAPFPEMVSDTANSKASGLAGFTYFDPFPESISDSSNSTAGGFSAFIQTLPETRSVSDSANSGASLASFNVI